jgi:hypothetical protein
MKSVPELRTLLEEAKASQHCCQIFNCFLDANARTNRPRFDLSFNCASAALAHEQQSHKAQ